MEVAQMDAHYRNYKQYLPPGKSSSVSPEIEEERKMESNHQKLLHESKLQVHFSDQKYSQQ